MSLDVMRLLSASTAIVPDDKQATPIELGCIKYVVALNILAGAFEVLIQAVLGKSITSSALS